MKPPPKKNDFALTVRVPRDVLDRIDFLVRLRRSKIPRHSWLLEAIYEKLAREGEMMHEGSLRILWENSDDRATPRYRLTFNSYSPAHAAVSAIRPKRFVGDSELEAYLLGINFDRKDSRQWVKTVKSAASVTIGNVRLTDEELATYGYRH
jgi:hypothetical protein